MKRLLVLMLSLSSPSFAQVVFTYAGPQTAIPASYFGMDSGHPQTTTPAMISVGTLLTMDASGWGQANESWAATETASGTYVWTAIDNIVSLAQSNSIPDIVYVVHNVPSWNSSNPSDATCAEGSGTCDPNASTAAFVTFMNAITQRYCGKIDYWEGWNEANSAQFWNASIPLLVTYMSAMYTAVHATANCACVGSTCSPGQAGGTNPNQMLMPPLSSPALFTATELNNGSSGYNINLTYWLTQYLAAGGGSYYDIAALHSYGANATCYAGPEAYPTDVASFKQVLATAHLPVYPIWATELNWGANTCVTTGTAQDAWIARYLLLHWAMGFARELWYEYDASGTFGTIEPGTNQLTTYQEMQKWMTGAIQTNCQRYANANWICEFSRSSPSGYVAYAAWNATGTGSYTVPSGIVQYRDVLNNITASSGGSIVSLTTSPLLFETVAGAF